MEGALIWGPLKIDNQSYFVQSFKYHRQTRAGALEYSAFVMSENKLYGVQGPGLQFILCHILAL